MRRLNFRCILVFIYIDTAIVSRWNFIRSTIINAIKSNIEYIWWYKNECWHLIDEFYKIAFYWRVWKIAFGFCVRFFLSLWPPHWVNLVSLLIIDVSNENQVINEILYCMELNKLIKLTYRMRFSNSHKVEQSPRMSNVLTSFTYQKSICYIWYEKFLSKFMYHTNSIKFKLSLEMFGLTRWFIFNGPAKIQFFFCFFF